MDDKNLEDIQVQADKKRTNKKVPDLDLDVPKKMDLEAGHRKVMMVMIGIFVVILLLMVFLQNHMEFASSGGM